MTTAPPSSSLGRRTRNWRERLGTWRSKLVFLLLAFSLLPIGVLSLLQAESITKIFIESQLASLTALARAKAGAVEQFVQDRKTEVERIAPILAEELVTLQATNRATGDQPEEALPDLRDAEALQSSMPEETVGVAPVVAESSGQTGAPEALSDLREKLGLILWDQSKFEELLIIDDQGKVIVSTHAPHEGKSAAELEYFKAGRGATYLQPVFISPITGRLSMVVSTPIRDPKSQTVGVLAARLNLGRLFQRVNDVTGLGKTGETVVGKRIDEEVVFMAPTRHDPAAALERKIARDAEGDRPLRDAVSGQSGSGERVDYRQRRVLAAWERIPSLEWGMVVKIDEDEVMLPVRQARRQLLVFALFLILAATICSILAARALLAPLNKLERAADQVSRGNLDIDLDIHSRDEIGDLAESFERMIAAIRFFRAHSREADDADEEENEES